MKRISDLIRPFLGIVFGALLLLVYLNYLQADIPGRYIALGVIAVIIASFYLASAIVIFAAGDKLPAGLKNIFNVLGIVLFPTLIFVENIISIVDLEGALGTTGWILMTTSLVGSLTFAALYCVAVFSKVKVIERLAFLFGSIFFLSLVLSILFAADGRPLAIDEVALVIIALYAIYSGMLFNALINLNKKEQE